MKNSHAPPPPPEFLYTAAKFPGEMLGYPQVDCVVRRGARISIADYPGHLTHAWDSSDALGVAGGPPIRKTGDGDLFRVLLHIDSAVVVKAKFITLSWSQTGPKLIAHLQRAGIWPIRARASMCDRSTTSLGPARIFRLSIHALVAKIWPDKIVRWWRDGEFCVLYFQRAARSKFQTQWRNRGGGRKN